VQTCDADGDIPQVTPQGVDYQRDIRKAASRRFYTPKIQFLVQGSGDYRLN
jgi:hypothetical protein